MAADDSDLATDRTLAALRREIDSIDEAIHDLLARRAAVVDRVAATKGRAGQRGGAPLFRAGREASIVRRLVGRTRPPLSAETVVAVWREIISAFTRSQGPFMVVAYAPADSSRYADLARAHFGYRAPIQLETTVASTLAALERGRAQVAVVPLPGDEVGRDGGWWRGLGSGAAAKSGDLQILARLPILGSRSTSGAHAVVVGRQPFDPSDDDRGYILVETETHISRARLRTALEAARLQAVDFPAATEEKVTRGRAAQYQLVELTSWVPGDDPRLRRLASALGDGARARSLGGYAQPITSGPSKRK
jgi:chorismate mutase / prephenate dehydratase